jgi:methylenetetrahydrofolate reductase (NADPH)
MRLCGTRHKQLPVTRAVQAMESQKKYPPVFSFEFFPPKTRDGVIKLKATSKVLAGLKPRFFSVTFGAGGETRHPP